jgi:hypothetical protein
MSRGDARQWRLLMLLLDHRKILAGGISSLVLTLGVCLATPGAQAAQVYDGTFTALNDSGLTGTAMLSLDTTDSMLMVTIHATGLEAGVPHVAHIHGLFSEGASGTPVDSTSPTLAQDSDHDGFVELAEGQTTYGPIIVPLVDFDSAETSTVDYTHTFNLLDPSIYSGMYTEADLLGADFNDLDLRELVIHGLTVPPGPGAGTPGEVDGTNGYLGVLPVASAEIAAAPEPSTWAMMILGFGGLAALQFRWKRRGVKAFA